jgi:hypothetical protein
MSVYSPLMTEVALLQEYALDALTLELGVEKQNFLYNSGVAYQARI